MVKAKKFGKLSLIVGIALAVVLLFAIVSMNSANAEDFLSKDGENFSGGPHWYLYITNYKILPPGTSISLWSTESLPAYGQTVSHADLVARNGMIRIPAGVCVYVSTNLTVNEWHMLPTDIEGAAIFNGVTKAPAINADNVQKVYGSICGINGIPVGDHIIGLTILCDDSCFVDGDCDSDSDCDCDADCDSDCDSDCDADCDSDCDSDSDCDADCDSDCDSDCDADCDSDCASDCDADCDSDCDSDCDCDCDSDCDSDCDCDADCDSDCDSDSDKPDNPDNPDNPPKPPKTGDTRSIALIAVFALLSAAVLATTFRKKSGAEH